MLTWKTIEDLPGRTPVPLDLALEALQPDNPRALLLHLYGGGHLLEELPPDAIMKWSREALAEMGAATHQFDKRLAPVETMTPYLTSPSTWAQLHILREELLALRPAPKLEASPAGKARKIVLPDHQEAGPELIGSTFVYTWKGIAAELDASVDTAKRYAKRGLVVLTTPSGRVATTKEEIARWSKTLEGRRLIKK